MSPSILCISLSPLVRDARVLRQLEVLAAHGEVTTVGFGPQPAGATHHIQVPDGLPTLPQTPLGVLQLVTHRFRRAELAAPAVQFALRALAGRRYDLVVANDARVLALAFAAADGAPVWADMHEWAIGQRDQYFVWRHLVAPLMGHYCRQYLPRAAAVTTVAASLVREYDRVYGLSTQLVRNARGFEPDLRPTPVAPGGTVRLVHSGGAEPNRKLTWLIDATRAQADATLDLYLVTGGDPGHLEELRRYAGGDPRIRFREPVPPADLPRTLNDYDLGVFSLPPDNFNMAHTLPNKLFDFVQARLGIVVSPSVEMAQFVRDNELGAVADDYSAASLAAAVASMTPERIAAAKQSAQDRAMQLSNIPDLEVSHRIVAGLLGDR